jgi:CRP-like cAMP-binding protein
VEISIIDANGKKNILAQLQQGDFFGEFSLLDGGERSATAIATDHTTLLGFFRPDLFSLMDRNPRMGNKLLLALAKVVVARLRKTTELLIQQQSMS